jgi:sugar phosphate isomerase/epimerase
MAKIQPSLQLYTLRNLTKTDFAGTLRQVAKIGYTGIELAGYGNLATAKEARKAADDAGLKIVGVHANIDRLEKELSKVFDEQAELGNKNIMCPHIGEARRKDAVGWQQVAQSLNLIGAACRQRGFEFAYHNHSFEFQKFDGRTGFDILWENSQPANVKSELDVYWVQHGGADPVAYMERLGSRVLALHLKDMAAGPERKFAPLGSGILDFGKILAAAAKLGVVIYVVEQDDTYDLPPMEAVRASLQHLQKLGVV